MDTKTITINISKDDNDRFTGRVPVSVNGQVAHVPMGVDTEVGEHIASVLTDAGIKFTVVSPTGETDAGGEGVSPPASSILVGSPLNSELAPEEMAPAAAGNERALTEATELNDDAPSTDVQISGTTPVNHNEDGSSTLANSVVTALGTNEGDIGSDGETGDESGDETEEPGPLDKSIPDLTDHIATVEDAAEIDRLIAAETAGKSRTGAMAALNARKEALAAA